MYKKSNVKYFIICMTAGFLLISGFGIINMITKADSPGIVVTKTANTTFSKVGDSVEFNVSVENMGDVLGSTTNFLGNVLFLLTDVKAVNHLLVFFWKALDGLQHFSPNFVVHGFLLGVKGAGIGNGFDHGQAVIV